MVTNRSSRNYNQEYPITNRNSEPYTSNRYADYNSQDRENQNYRARNYNVREPYYSYNSQPYPLRNNNRYNEYSSNYPMNNFMERPSHSRVDYNYYPNDAYYPQARNRNFEPRSGRNNYNYDNYSNYSQPIRYPVSTRFEDGYNQPNYGNRDNYYSNRYYDSRDSNFRDSRNSRNYNNYPQDRYSYAPMNQDVSPNRYNNRYDNNLNPTDYPDYRGNRRRSRENY